MKTLTLVISFALFANAGADDAVKDELAKYQGTWVLVSEEFEGRAVPDGELSKQSYTVRGDKVVYNVNGEERSATLRLDPSKSPKTYDLARDDGSRTLKGVYEWDGDRLKVCAADDGGDRPADFTTGPGSKNRVRVWERQK